MIKVSKNKYCKGWLYKQYYYEDERLQHDFLGLGEKLKNHKYFAREENKDGQANKYTYFYSKEAWDAFKNKGNQLIEKAKGLISNIKDSYDIGLQSIRSTLSTSANTKVSSIKNYLGDVPFRQKFRSLVLDTISKFDGTFGSAKKRIVKNNRSAGIEHGDIIINKGGDTDSGGHKYVGKIKMPPDNKWRYYYTEKALNSAIEQYNYRQADDPYMQKFNSIKGGEHTAHDSKDNGDRVNPGHRASGTYRGVNCIYCTLATELRMRGYDVQAKDVRSIDGRDSIGRTFGIDRSKGAETQRFTVGVMPNYKDKYLSDAEEGKNQPYQTRNAGGVAVRGWEQTYSMTPNESFDQATIMVNTVNNDNVKNIVPAMAATGYALGRDKDDGYTGKVVNAIEKALSDYPAGARGNLSIKWDGGGGHSEYWEKDENGKIVIYDTQGGTMKTDDLAKLIKNSNWLVPIEFMRFDDCAIVDPTVIKQSIEKN